MKRPPPIVLVEWEDARTVEGGPWVVNEAIAYKPHIVQQVGYLISDTPAGVILTQAWHPDLVAVPDQIPRGMIRKITPLKPAAPGRKS